MLSLSRQQEDSAQANSSISQAQREHLFHIDFRLYCLGSVNRIDLVSRFGIKEAASSDFSFYKGVASRNIEYDTKAKSSSGISAVKYFNLCSAMTL